MNRSIASLLEILLFFPRQTSSTPLFRQPLNSQHHLLAFASAASTRPSTRVQTYFLKGTFPNRAPSIPFNPYGPRPYTNFPIRSGARPLSQFGKSARASKQPVSKTPPHIHKYSSRPSILQQSGSGSWAITVVVGLLSGALLYTVAPGTTKVVGKERPPKSPVREFEDQYIGNCHNMTGEALPGRPGTLTEIEEEKLKEFWIATLQVFGTLDAKQVNGNGAAEPTPGVTRVDTKKEKKKRLGFLRSKKKDDTSETASIASTPATGASEDKYGQTQEFYDALANMSPETLRVTFWSMVKHDHPDALLLRFLRARKWDVEKALVMMVSTMRWRSSEMHVDDDIMKNGELGALDDEAGADTEKKKLGHDFLDQMRMGKSFLHGLDKMGRPMCFVRARLHKQGDQSEASLERYTVFLIESARMVLAPPVDTACVVFDLTGFSMANMDYAPVKFMIKCFEANYPESLGVVLVHKAPWVFQGIWKIIKGWLDPVVASKVHFTNDNTAMEAFVPKSRIIKELQGSEDWAYSYIEPVPGENDKMKDTETRDKLLAVRELIVKDYEKATLDWIQGTGDAAVVKMQRNEVANQLRDDYWKLDPFVRARSYYDRVGIINPGGRLQFYPPNAAAPVIAPVADDVTNGAELKTVETLPNAPSASVADDVTNGAELKTVETLLNAPSASPNDVD